MQLIDDFVTTKYNIELLKMKLQKEKSKAAGALGGTTIAEVTSWGDLGIAGGSIYGMQDPAYWSKEEKMAALEFMNSPIFKTNIPKYKTKQEDPKPGFVPDVVPPVVTPPSAPVLPSQVGGAASGLTGPSLPPKPKPKKPKKPKQAGSSMGGLY